ncbi:hypothetical protein ACFWCA_08155 [Streptomyces phaeochromogenes]|uniref:hypothetical protein n=1 Tax=Streptomyces phaeochromogenes TaxID=1923 RepID=UPI0036A1916A
MAEPTHEERLVIYQMAAARRFNYESIAWQIPGLSLTAQAFLMTIGLAPGAGHLARVAAGFLAIVVSLLTIHSVLRHRRHELADSIWLSNFERSEGWETVHDAASVRASRLGIPESAFGGRYKVTYVWLAGLSLFGLVGLGIMISGIVG